MDTYAVALVAAFVVVYAAVSARLERTVVTGPIVFVAVGTLAGPRFTDALPLELSSTVVKTLAEVTLVMVLFTDAARIRFRSVHDDAQLPRRLLGIGLPLTIVAGTVTAWLVFGIDLWVAALIGTVLAPTDAALGQVVVSSARVPLRVRQALNVESGLNDGIAAPLVTLFIAGASAAGDVGSASSWVVFGAKQIGFGLAGGVAVGLAGGWAVSRAMASSWVKPAYQHIAMLALAVLAFSVTEASDGNGFIAVFVAGLLVGNAAGGVREGLYSFAAEEGDLLQLLTFLAFGAAFVGPVLDELTWRIALYAALSLTVVRMAPVALALVGTRLTGASVVFMGWFGPRGLASIVYGLLVLDEMRASGGDEVLLVVTWTVLASIVVHGLTSRPLTARYGAYCDEQAERFEAAGETRDMGAAATVPTRHGPIGRRDAPSPRPTGSDGASDR